MWFIIDITIIYLAILDIMFISSSRFRLLIFVILESICKSKVKMDHTESQQCFYCDYCQSPCALSIIMELASKVIVGEAILINRSTGSVNESVI